MWMVSKVLQPYSLICFEVRLADKLVCTWNSYSHRLCATNCGMNTIDATIQSNRIKHMLVSQCCYVAVCGLWLVARWRHSNNLH